VTCFVPFVGAVLFDGIGLFFLIVVTFFSFPRPAPVYRSGFPTTAPAPFSFDCGMTTVMLVLLSIIS